MTRPSGARLTAAVRILTLVAAVAIFALALAPGDPRVVGSDKGNHILAFSVLAGLARLGWSRTHTPVGAVVLILFGIAIEMTQALPWVGRDASVADVIADGAGIATGLLLGTLCLRLLHVSPRR